MTKKKRETNRSLLEFLPNELFEEIFSYLNGVYIIYAFSNLNSRFERLLFNLNYSYLAFKSKSKYQFDLSFRYSNSQQCKSLKLYNDQLNYGQIEYFFQIYSLFPEFSSLEYLSIISCNYLNEFYLSNQLFNLSNLVSLTLKSVCGEKMSQFNLPNLRKLVFSSCTNTKWLTNLSRLEIIDYTIVNCLKFEENLVWPLNLKKIKIIFSNDGDIPLIQQSLVNLSELLSLEIYQEERSLIAPNGSQWEELIKQSFPLLKTFQFYFQFQSVLYTFEYFQEILSLFQTSFYELDKHCFVRCDISYRDQPYAAIYSLPFSFHRLNVFTNLLDKSISTSRDRFIYKNVKTLVFEEKSILPDSNFRQTRIENLILNTHFEPIYWLKIFTRLKSLEIHSSTVLSKKNFLVLFKDCHLLHSLTIDKTNLWLLTENWTNLDICHCLKKKIYSLKLLIHDHQSQVLNFNEVKQLTKSIQLKCRHLSIAIQTNIQMISFLLTKIKPLRCLHLTIENKDYPLITLDSLNQIQTDYQFNQSNCFIINEGFQRSFWLGKH